MIFFIIPISIQARIIFIISTSV